MKDGVAPSQGCRCLQGRLAATSKQVSKATARRKHLCRDVANRVGTISSLRARGGGGGGAAASLDPLAFASDLLATPNSKRGGGAGSDADPGSTTAAGIEALLFSPPAGGRGATERARAPRPRGRRAAAAAAAAAMPGRRAPPLALLNLVAAPRRRRRGRRGRGRGGRRAAVAGGRAAVGGGPRLSRAAAGRHAAGRHAAGRHAAGRGVHGAARGRGACMHAPHARACG